MTKVDILRDISDQYEFIEQSLVYVDAPLEGFLRARAGGLLAFRCSSIIPGYLWHWVLIPVGDIEPIKKVFDAARTNPPKEWVSIIEDRRGEPRLTAARLMGGVHEIPRNVFEP